MPDDYRILLVERNRPSTARLRNWLQARQYRVISAATAKEALDRIREEVPDLILLNRSSADTDGLDVARKLRRSQRYSDLPIILMTRLARAGQEELEVGVDDFILRPLRFDEVGIRIRTMLKRREAVRGLQKKNLRLKEANWKLRQILIYDAKTNLYNYRYFTERIEEEFKRADRYENFLSCIMLDLDRFKRVNDRHGHPAGDAVLKNFGTVLSESVRETDFVARYGGEEFAIILPQTDGPNARILGERIRTATGGSRFPIDGGSVAVSVSLGIATYPSNRRIACSADLVKVADAALLLAKQAGRNRTHLDEASGRPGPKIDSGRGHRQRRRRRTDPS